MRSRDAVVERKVSACFWGVEPGEWKISIGSAPATGSPGPTGMHAAHGGVQVADGASFDEVGGLRGACRP